MRTWTTRQWWAAVAGTLGSLVVLGVPSVLIPNGLFAREIAPTWWSYPVWVVTAVLAGLLIATYAGPRGGETCPTRADRKGLAGGLLAWFAIACPVCNKLVLLALGYSGALAWFAPLQPVLAVVGVGLLVLALRIRLRRATPTPAASGRDASTEEPVA
ncbi:hypothetical protein J4H86_18060 [Spiractinospora alimapuensis]|uniref:hypothetical protein n=1 Tax=Spiractinospora alimapuensis TaxID=2820884 RepID=UPI001F39AA17|nr:hypothetical protein [Spiractinospora alimapuensis]QVQ50771.1 hypothetical protein J4H86_18060 [Spiractinospora alimapuensis]